MSPTLTWVPGTYSAARRDDVLDPITADILHVDGEPTRWAVQIEHDPKGVTDIGDVFFGGMRLPFVTPRGRAPGLDCAADVAAAHVAAARAIAEAIIAAAGLIGTDDPVVIVGRMEATWQGVGCDAYLAFIAAADPSPPDGYIPAPVGCFDEDDDWSGDGGDHWGDDGGPELVAALNLCATLRAERDAAEDRGYRLGAAACLAAAEAVLASVERRADNSTAGSTFLRAYRRGSVNIARQIRDSLLSHAGERAPMTDIESKARPLPDAPEVARLRAESDALADELDAMEAEAARLRAVIAEAAAELPLHPADGHLTPPEADAEAVRVALLAALGGAA